MPKNPRTIRQDWNEPLFKFIKQHFDSAPEYVSLKE